MAGRPPGAKPWLSWSPFGLLGKRFPPGPLSALPDPRNSGGPGWSLPNQLRRPHSEAPPRLSPGKVWVPELGGPTESWQAPRRPGPHLGPFKQTRPAVWVHTVVGGSRVGVGSDPRHPSGQPPPSCRPSRVCFGVPVSSARSASAWVGSARLAPSSPTPGPQVDRVLAALPSLFLGSALVASEEGHPLQGPPRGTGATESTSALRWSSTSAPDLRPLESGSVGPSSPEDPHRLAADPTPDSRT